MAAAPPPPLPEELQEEVILRFPRHESAPPSSASAGAASSEAPGSGAGSASSTARRPCWGSSATSCWVWRGLKSIGGGLKPPDHRPATCPPRPSPSACRTPTTAAAALDARHGRVLLQCRGVSGVFFMVWDPITDDKHQVPSSLLHWYMWTWTAAVLCAACGRCDHLDCHCGPFLVVYMGYGSGGVVVCTYSSDAGTWSDPISTEQTAKIVNSVASVLVGNALYFGCLLSKTLINYGMESHKISVNQLPFINPLWRHVVLDNELGLATVHESKLCLWKKAGPEVDAGWTENRVIELKTLLPSDAFLTNVVGFADGIDVIFLRAGSVLYTIDTKNYKVKKVYEGKSIDSVIPYMSFFTPALGAVSTGAGPGVGASST